MFNITIIVKHLLTFEIKCLCNLEHSVNTIYIMEYKYNSIIFHFKIIIFYSLPLIESFPLRNKELVILLST